MVGVTALKVNVTQEISFDNLSPETNIPNTQAYRMSPLHELIWLARDQEQVQEVQEFIEAKQESGDIGDILRTYDRDGRSVLMYAIIRKNIPIAKKLIEAKIPVNYTTEEVCYKFFFFFFLFVSKKVHWFCFL